VFDIVKLLLMFAAIPQTGFRRIAEEASAGCYFRQKSLNRVGDSSV
jgi:hypothetical protein